MGFSNIARFLLISYNLCFCFIGIFLIIVGILSQANSNFLNDSWKSLEASLGAGSLMVGVSQISWSLIFIGFVTLVLGGVGFCGTYKKSRTLLILYLVLILILISVKLAAIYMLVSYQSIVILEFQGLFDTALKKAVSTNLTAVDAGSAAAIQAISATQMFFQCCGSNGSSSYTNYSIPPTCYPSSNSTLTFTVGCDSQIANYMNNEMPIILYSLSVVVVIEVMAVIFSLCVFNKIETQ